jgi:hypothetical protein
MTSPQGAGRQLKPLERRVWLFVVIVWPALTLLVITVYDPMHWGDLGYYWSRSALQIVVFCCAPLIAFGLRCAFQCFVIAPRPRLPSPPRVSPHEALKAEVAAFVESCWVRAKSLPSHAWDSKAARMEAAARFARRIPGTDAARLQDVCAEAVQLASRGEIQAAGGENGAGDQQLAALIKRAVACANWVP